MKSVIEIIKIHGGMEALAANAVRVDPPSEGFMRLCIELIGSGPLGRPLISVAHYFEQNGDLMADPEITFEIQPNIWWDSRFWTPTTFTNHATGTYQEACFKDEESIVKVRPGLIKDLKSFARIWNRNIKSQGYAAAFREQRRTQALAN